jgi:hypothetical protein
MKIFKCGSCDQVVYFESFVCTRCNHTLAFLPNHGVIGALEPAGDNLWTAVAPHAGEHYRLCRNYTEEAVCNWAIHADESEEYCLSCRLNHALPPTSDPETKREWQQLETAKRRLLYTLTQLELPIENKKQNPETGLAFDFLKDDDDGDPSVFTGHSEGVITINIAEADDPFREKMREQMGEAYRTVLGHFRHESGHYYWERLIANSPHLETFRELFGDEQQDYNEARKRYYAEGPPPEWWENYVSSYASMHPWEDWAETWAHYLHMVDGLETARAHGLSLQPPQASAETLALSTRRLNLHSFDDLVKSWIPLTLSLNSMNRSFGAKDCYPFVLTPKTIDKLHFVHDVIEFASHPASAEVSSAT